MMRYIYTKTQDDQRQFVPLGTPPMVDTHVKTSRVRSPFVCVCKFLKKN